MRATPSQTMGTRLMKMMTETTTAMTVMTMITMVTTVTNPEINVCDPDVDSTPPRQTPSPTQTWIA